MELAGRSLNVSLDLKRSPPIRRFSLVPKLRARGQKLINLTEDTSRELTTAETIWGPQKSSKGNKYQQNFRRSSCADERFGDSLEAKRRKETGHPQALPLNPPPPAPAPAPTPFSGHRGNAALSNGRRAPAAPPRARRSPTDLAFSPFCRHRCVCTFVGPWNNEWAVYL